MSGIVLCRVVSCRIVCRVVLCCDVFVFVCVVWGIVLSVSFAWRKNTDRKKKTRSNVCLMWLLYFGLCCFVLVDETQHWFTCVLCCVVS